jgi:hypothetical protein
MFHVDLVIMTHINTWPCPLISLLLNLIGSYGHSANDVWRIPYEYAILIGYHQIFSQILYKNRIKKNKVISDISLSKLLIFEYCYEAFNIDKVGICSRGWPQLHFKISLLFIMTWLWPQWGHLAECQRFGLVYSLQITASVESSHILCRTVDNLHSSYILTID